jgi:hypothetical protein
MHVSNRGDLTVDERRRSSQRLQSRSLFAVPRRRRFVVRQDRKRSAHDVAEIRLERRAALAFRQSPTSIGEFVPDWRCNGALRTALVQTLKNRCVRCLRDRGRHDTCVEKICEIQRDTLRPVVRSRVEAAKSSSTPMSRREWLLRNFLYASRKCRRFPRSRSNSRCETSTATGRPRRVSSISTPDSAWSTIVGSRDRASAIEYLCDICSVYIKMYKTATGRADKGVTDCSSTEPGRQTAAHRLRACPRYRCYHLTIVREGDVPWGSSLCEMLMRSGESV